MKKKKTTPSQTPAAAWQPAVGAEVVLDPSTDRAVRGQIIEDFGESEPHAVEVNNVRIAEAARRWAVLTDAGHLVFVDTCQLAHTPAPTDPD